VTQHGGMATSVEGEATPRRGKGGDDANWGDANLTRLKNNKNSHDRFSCCYTTKCEMMEDGLTECASEGNLGGSKG
jgi:hypothetical protein